VKRVASVLAGLLAASVLVSCGSSNADVPKVVATAYPLYEAAATVGGKHVHAINLLPLDPYGPLPNDKAEELKSAPLAIVLGGGTQPEVDAIVAQRTGRTISILGDDDFHAADPDHNVWLDPQRMTQIADAVSDALVQLVPERAQTFHDNLDRYNGDIADVDRDWVQTLATCKRHEFLVEKPEFSSFARRYNLQQITIGPIDPNATNEMVRQTIDTTHASTVFAKTLPPLDDAQEIRDRYGVRVAVLDPITSQTDQARRGGSSWRIVMGLDLDALRAALSCDPKQH
jgi:zinc transport system substrate-binding protein